VFYIHSNVTVICEIDAGDDIGHVSSLEFNVDISATQNNNNKKMKNTQS
jgi:hypothetical protein